MNRCEKYPAACMVLGKNMGEKHVPDSGMLNQYSHPEKLNFINRTAINIYYKMGNIFYRKAKVRQNGVIDRINDRPYAE